MRFIKGFLLTVLLVVSLAVGFIFSSFNSVVESDPFAVEITPEPVVITPAPTPEVTPEPVAATPEPTPEIEITLKPYNGEKLSLSLEPGESVNLEECSVPENHTYIGWIDGSGKIHSGSAVFSESAVLNQLCVPCFSDGSHGSLLSLEDGIFRASGSVERIELARFFNEYLSADDSIGLIEGSGFLDLNKDSGLHDIGCRLKYYRAADGKDFNPGEALSYGDAWAMLSVFMPVPEGLDRYPVKAGDSEYALACAEFYGWIPEGFEGIELYDRDITRLDYVKLLCCVLGRSGDSELKQDYVGTILDIPLSFPDFWQIAEAVIPHSCTGSGNAEVWTDSTPSSAESFVKGINLSDGRVYYVKDDGALAVDEEINGFSYGPDGVYTSGNAELDELIIKTIRESGAEKERDNLERLRKVFYHIVYNSTYRKGELYEDGSRDWVYEQAISMLSTQKGNCYSFASAFWACARALGYDAEVFTGVLRSSVPARPHGWVEVKVNGTYYLCDPEISYQQIKIMHEFIDMFMQNNLAYTHWGYERYENQR